MHVPDHGGLAPWQIVAIQGDDREAFAELLVLAYRHDTQEPDEARIAKLRLMGNSAPTILVVASRLRRQAKVPEIEQLLSAGALCQNILIAARLAGFSSNWLTGPVAYSAKFKDMLAIAPDDHIVGFLFLGTADIPPKPRPRPKYEAVVRSLPGQLSGQMPNGER